MKKSLRSRVTTLQLLALLTAFVAVAAVVVTRLIQQQSLDRSEAWAALEAHLHDPKRCTDLLAGKKRGDGLAELVGKEWQESGWIVRDAYILRTEDEVSWQLTSDEDPTPALHVKLSLIPRPPQGQSLSVDHFLAAESSSRFVKLEAQFAQSSQRGPAGEGEHQIVRCK